MNTTDMAKATIRGSQRSSITPTKKVDSAVVTVFEPKSIAKIRPRIRSGVRICSIVELNVHKMPVHMCANITNNAPSANDAALLNAK